MIENTKTTKIKKIASILILLIIISLFSSIITPFTASAAVLTHSDVMDDLQEDSKFDVTKYPLMSYDHFSALNSDEDTTNDVEYLSVIHIAESKDKELFVYTYQPLNNLSDITATSVALSIGEGAVNYEKYTLKCVSYEGPFKKYLVEDFTVPSDFYRYYNISEIERPFDILLDEKISNETITDYKAHKVGQTWCCYYKNNELIYEMSTLDVVEITPTLTDFLYLKDGITWGSLVGINTACSAHYIAFNIDNYEADKIVDASLEYSWRAFKTFTYSETGVFPFLGSLFGRENEHTTTQYPEGLEYHKESLSLYNIDVASNNGSGLFAKEYSWNRIMAAQDFKERFINQGVVFSESTATALDNSEWVFAFTETPVSHYASFVPAENPWGTSYETRIMEGSEVSKVDILRLKFEVKGETYNLGVVGDTTTGDNIAGGSGIALDFDFDTAFEKIMALLLLILLLVLINPVMSILILIFKIIFKAIGVCLDVVFNILTFPLRLIFNRK